MSRSKPRLTPDDIQGAWAIIPTPATARASDWREANTIDLDETARVVDGLIAAGVDGILSLGTFGEGSTLTWDEKQAFIATVVETARGRIPVFGGTTSLNTRESVRQTRVAADIGVDGTMVGPPMWCRADVPPAVSEAPCITTSWLVDGPTARAGQAGCERRQQASGRAGGAHSIAAGRITITRN